MSTYLVNRSPSSAMGFKTLIDMLGFFGWLVSIKKGMLEQVKVKCIFMGYYKGIVGNKLWRLDDVTSKEGHAFEVEPLRNVGQGDGSHKVQTQDLIYYHSARDREQHSAWEQFSYREDSNVTVFAVAVVDKIYAHESLTFNNTVACEQRLQKYSDDSDGYYLKYIPGFMDKANGNVLGMEIVRDQSGNTLRVSQSRFYNGKLVQTLLEGHSILSLEGSLSGDCDVEKNGTDNQEKDEKQSQNDKTGLGMEKL
ncbi:hypothetical protein Tco_0859884 [Tanacetum coccineum]|uniref:Zinc finger, CCHC-type n=1 Tax=Tanacetum coccineum TaxID=301880 RepID=A0ABQ5BFK3_9ASTR